MTNRKILRTAAIVAGTIGATVALTSPAGAAEPASLSIDGDLQIAPNVSVLGIDAVGTRTAAGVTSGTYVATVKLGGSSLPIQVKGPVTCIYTKGNTASLVYPITGSTPDILPAGARGALAVQITVRTGAADMVGVMGPMPTSSFRGCNPGPTPFPFSGDVETS
ncbi:hypothetical protein [Gordonia soli]|uniref:Tat pathway signal sequence domain protein n=1 Tax=Gordonia soli NBRC 108243 TaxID=1223545 RepID=M0QMM6_9ACTN|nr:hypothetical protein [Gordonia soli]GAC68672.1 hypothetical protein GS4_17_00580 [Gordonia soli NBRC 108243]